MGIPTVIYTMIGGVQAVTWVDVKQMVLIVFALIAVVVTLLAQLPVAPDHALALAGAAGGPPALDFSFGLTHDFPLWGRGIRRPPLHLLSLRHRPRHRPR